MARLGVQGSCARKPRGPLPPVGVVPALLSLSLSLSLTQRLVALLLGDKETQLSPATTLGGTLASTVPASASGVTVTPKEDPGL